MEKGKVAEKVAKGFFGAASAVALASAMGVKVDGVITRIAKIFIYPGITIGAAIFIYAVGLGFKHVMEGTSVPSDYWGYFGGVVLSVSIGYLLAGIWIAAAKFFMWIFIGSTKPSRAPDLVLESRDSNRIDELEKRIKELESKK